MRLKKRRIVPNMKYFIAIFVSVLFVPFFAHAETVLRVGDAITVDENQVVNGDYYVSVGPFGNTSMSGTIEGDMYALGGSVNANGSITEDLTIISGVSQIHASVTDDVRIVSGEVTIAEYVGGDLVVIAGSLKVLSTATIGGNIFFFGGEGVIDGTVGGSIFGTSKRLRVDGPVGQDINVTAISGLTLGSRASIEGDVSYTSLQSLVRSPDAVVEGEVNIRAYEKKNTRDEMRDILIPIFITLFATLSLYLLFRDELIKLVRRVDSSYGTSALIGIAAILLGPVVSLLLIVTVLGLFVGLMSFAVVLLLYVVGFALTSVVCGAILSKFFTKRLSVSLLWILIGTLTIHAIGFIPIIGPLTVFALFSVTVGGISTSLYKLLS